MNIEKIRNANTKYLAKNIFYYKEIDSTQDEIRRLAENNVKNGSLVIADEQNKGYGTKGRIWHSQKEKNITLSFVTYPNCEINKIKRLTIKIAEAIVDSIQELYGYKLLIKKPNDIILKNKKIAGILTQSSTIQNRVNQILVGIGLNVNQEEFPQELKEIATSLKKEYKIEFEREEIIIKLLEKLDEIIADIIE